MNSFLIRGDVTYCIGCMTMLCRVLCLRDLGTHWCSRASWNLMFSYSVALELSSSSGDSIIRPFHRSKLMS